MLLPLLIKESPWMGIGLVIGAFCPAVCRKLKAWLGKEATAVGKKLR